MHSSRVGGPSGNGVGQPARARNLTVEICLPSRTQMSLPPASRTICGTWSRYFAGTRAVHTSGGSVMWVSASRCVYVIAMGPVCTTRRDLAPGDLAAGTSALEDDAHDEWI